MSVRRTTHLDRSPAAGLYRAVVTVLRAAGFYDARNERYSSLVWNLVGTSLRVGRVVVDLGCGPGGITVRLRGGHLLIGVYSDRFSLQRFADPTIQRIQARAERLPLKNGSVGIVVAISLVEHISDQGAFFRELARVLEPEGEAVLQFPELRFPIEPHTKWPVLHAWDPRLQARVLAATGYEDLNLATSLAGLLRAAQAAGFFSHRVVPIWHFRLARVARRPMGYLAVFKKDGG